MSAYCAADDLVQEAAGLARIARHFRHAFLVVVELLQRHHRHVDVVLLEAEQARRIVHQHVGVQYEQLGSGAQTGDCGTWKKCGEEAGF